MEDIYTCVWVALVCKQNLNNDLKFLFVTHWWYSWYEDVTLSNSSMSKAIDVNTLPLVVREIVILLNIINTWFLASNRRVGVWSLPWRWHILSIQLTTGRGTSAETCGLDDVFPPDDLGSRPEALCWYIYIYICMYIPYTSSVRGRIYNGSVIQYWRNCTPSRSIGECAVPRLNVTFCFLWFTNCVLLFDKNLMLECLWLLVFVLNNILILGIWCAAIPHLPGCFCPWTFFENIVFNTVLTDLFMSHLATQLGYSAGEFQALQLIVLAAFGDVD